MRKAIKTVHHTHPDKADTIVARDDAHNTFVLTLSPNQQYDRIEEMHARAALGLYRKMGWDLQGVRLQGGRFNSEYIWTTSASMRINVHGRITKGIYG